MWVDGGVCGERIVLLVPTSSVNLRFFMLTSIPLALVAMARVARIFGFDKWLKEHESKRPFITILNQYALSHSQ